MGKKEKTRSIRFDPEMLKQAEDLGIDINKLCRSAIESALKMKTCPTCGSKLKKDCDK